MKKIAKRKDISAYDTMEVTVSGDYRNVVLRRIRRVRRYKLKIYKKI